MSVIPDATGVVFLYDLAFKAQDTTRSCKGLNNNQKDYMRAIWREARRGNIDIYIYTYIYMYTCGC